MTMTIAEFDLPDSMALRPSRRPPVNESEFRAALTGLAATVHVITARRGAERVGRTATSVMSLSISPPAILVSIDIVSRLADVVAKTGGFSLAMLAQEQTDIADAFAGKLPPPERFGVGQWSQWPSGQPMLAGAVSVLDCEVIGAIETGTHVLYVGAVVEVETDATRSPLLWHRRGYHSVGGVD